MFAELPSLGFQASHETTVKRNTCDFQASDETSISLSEFLWYATNGDHMMYNIMRCSLLSVICNSNDF